MKVGLVFIHSCLANGSEYISSKRMPINGLNNLRGLSCLGWYGCLFDQCVPVVEIGWETQRPLTQSSHLSSHPQVAHHPTLLVAPTSPSLLVATAFPPRSSFSALGAGMARWIALGLGWVRDGWKLAPPYKGASSPTICRQRQRRPANNCAHRTLCDDVWYTACCNHSCAHSMMASKHCLL